MNKRSIEKYDGISDYPFFLDKLKMIEEYLGTEKFKLGNLTWTSKLKDKMKKSQYPSRYFIETIINTHILNNTIINPPIIIHAENTHDVRYIHLTFNQQLIMDALLKQGSNQRYQYKNEYLYSEHSGALTVMGDKIDQIIVFTDTDRLDISDSGIFLPNNSDNLSKYQFLFHTHPNTDTHAGRINKGIIFEFPSSNDIYNYVRYHPQASIVIAPEGSYVIRPICLYKRLLFDKQDHDRINSLILDLEKLAMNDNKKHMKNIRNNIDIFYEYVANDLTYISKLNQALRKNNIFIEYYPREKRNDEWHLRQISLFYHNV